MMAMSDFRPEVEIRCLAHVQWKICNISLIYGQIAKICTS